MSRGDWRCWSRTLSRVATRCGIVTLALVAVFSQAGHAATFGHGGPVYAPAFARLARSGSVDTAGNWVLLDHSKPGYDNSSVGRVWNVATRRSRQVHAPAGCTIFEISAWNVAFSCPSGPSPIELEPIAGGPPVGISTDGQIPNQLGRYWLRVTQPMVMEHQGAVYSFINLQTGQLIADPAVIGGTTYDDLSAPGLTQTACPPVRVGVAFTGTVAGVGSLAFVGPLAIHYGGNRQRIRLQRCDQQHSQSVSTAGFGFDRREVIWASGPATLQGIIATTGTRFVIRYPTSITPTGDPIDSVSLDSRDLFVQTEHGAVWSAPLPHQLHG